MEYYSVFKKNEILTHTVIRINPKGAPLVAQQVKDLVVLLLWCGFHPCSHAGNAGTSACCRCGQKKKKKKKKKLPWTHYAKWNKQGTKEQISYDSSFRRYLRVVRFTEKVKLWFQGIAGREGRELFNWHWILVWEDEEFWRWSMLVVGDNVSVFNAPELYT